MTTPVEPAELARRQMMTGMMLVMGACVFGGLTAVVLMMLNQRIGAMAVAGAAVLVIVAGVVIEVTGFRKMKAAQGQPK